MPRLRVFLCTYRRPQLLRRALRSLLAQTFSDWCCELHNDAPGDSAPEAILAELAPDDRRFVYCPHEKNWGAVAMFNHVFAGGPEPYATLLEDDNWWEPRFLATALAPLEVEPTAALIWANMRIWREEPDGAWRDTGRTIWKFAPGDRDAISFRAPEILQAFDALHSQGAMVFRPENFRVKSVPASTPLALIEPTRERAAVGPLLLLPEPLANFALTQQTARSVDATQWLQAKLVLAASFFSHVAVADDVLERMWSVRRAQRPPDTDIFFFLALLLRDSRFVRAASVRDWAHFLLSSARHPARFARGLRCRPALHELWVWLEQQSAGMAGPSAATILRKDCSQRDATTGAAGHRA
jgi:glycosyltransferase involved in cell wall biosynthesis